MASVPIRPPPEMVNNCCRKLVNKANRAYRGCLLLSVPVLTAVPRLRGDGPTTTGDGPMMLV